MRYLMLAAALAALPSLASAEADYRCSGIGEDRVTEEANFAHSLKLVYAQPDGSYLGDIATRITGPDGAVAVETTCEGPWLLVALPGGGYTVEATYEGQTKSVTVEVPASGKAREQVVTF